MGGSMIVMEDLRYLRIAHREVQPDQQDPQNQQEVRGKLVPLAELWKQSPPNPQDLCHGQIFLMKLTSTNRQLNISLEWTAKILLVQFIWMH